MSKELIRLSELKMVFDEETVLNSINRVEKNMKEQPELTEIIRDITNAVNSSY